MESLARLLSSSARLVREDSGQALVEYALILFLVAFVAFVAVGALGSQTLTLFQSVVDNF